MAEKFLSLSGMQTLWNKVKSVFATKTELGSKLNIPNSIDSNTKTGYMKILSLQGSSNQALQRGTIVFLSGRQSDQKTNFAILNITVDVNNIKAYIFQAPLMPNLYYVLNEDSTVIDIYMGVATWSMWNINVINYNPLNTIDRTTSIVAELPEGATAIPTLNINNASHITSGTLPIERGGTAATTAKGIVSNTIQGGLNVGNSDLTDEADIITTHASRGYTSETKDLYRRKATYLWNYIQSKIASVLGLTTDAYGGKAASATSADTATKATQDGSGNNIVNTYATKDGLESAFQSINGLTTGLSSKLDIDGSNANSTTTYNVLNAAAGGGSDEYSISDTEEIILTYPTGSTAYKRTLAKFAEWIEDKVMPIINRKLNAWSGNEQEVVFDNVKVRRGRNSSEVEVATYYGIAQSYYDMTYIDEELSSLQASVDSKIGFNNVKNITNSGMATNAATSSLPITIFYAGTGGNISSIYKAYVANSQEPLFLTCGRCIYLVNTTASNVEISGLSKGNYTLNAGRAMTIIYYTGSSGAMWYSPDGDD